MFINDLFEDYTPVYQDQKSDNSVKKMRDMRKSKLTLAQIKRLRMMNDVRKYEEQKKVEGLSKQYKPAAAAGAVPGL
jgi:hypothetical protein